MYFDFEGAWSRVLGLSGTQTYPKPLPSAPPDLRPRRRPSVEEVAGLTTVPFLAPDTSSAGVRAARRLSRSTRYRRRLEPYIARRYFLDPTALPGYLQWTLGSVVFVHGRLRDGSSPESPFLFLVTECGVRPFLYVTDGRDVLLAALSPAPPGPGSRASEPKPPVTDGLRRFLEGIEVFREGVSGLTALTNHRYDRLFQLDG